MLPATRRRPPSTAIATIAAVVAALVAAWLLAASGLVPSGARVASPPTAAVVVDGDRYAFTPKTCVIVDGAFVVSGPGTWNGQPFVASIAPGGGVELAFGVSNDVERPAPQRPWWLSGPITNYRIDGRELRGTVQVRDESGIVAGSRTARVEASCPSP